MTSFTNHLVRRGMETLEIGDRFIAEFGNEKIVVDGWAATLIVSTVIFFVLALFAIQYTYGELIATLAAIESTPSATSIIRTSPPPPQASQALANTDDEKKSLLSSVNDEEALPAANQEILLINPTPLTSRLCAIKCHLRAQGGRLARFRGLHIYMLNNIAFHALVSILTPPRTTNEILRLAIEIGSYTVLTRFYLLWTHMIISAPSNKSLRQRMPDLATVTRALAPTALYAFITKTATAITLHYTIRAQTHAQNVQDPALQAIKFLTVALLVTFVILVPAEIAITRVRASLLPSEEESIIPFDRSFGGAIRLSETGERKGGLSLWQAYTGCDLATRARVMGVYVKCFGMQLCVSGMGVCVVACEIWVLVGK